MSIQISFFGILGKSTELTKVKFVFINSPNFAPICSVTGLATAMYITFYKDINFSGQSTTIHAEFQGDCINIPEPFQHQVSSIDLPDGDLYVFDEPDCSGNVLRIYQYSTCTGYDLSCNTRTYGTACSKDCNHPAAVSWNDQPSSIMFFSV